MNNPISDKDWTMFPDNPELLERAKNGSERDRMAIHAAGIEIFGRRVRIGTFYDDRAKRTLIRSERGTWIEHKITIGNRNMGFRYIFEIGGDPDDWDLDPEYTLEPFKRSFLGFRVVRNK